MVLDDKVIIFFRERKELTDKNLSITKSLFDYAKTSGSHYSSKNLPDELFLEELDDEQIWQQLELQNESFWEKCMSETCRLLSLTDTKLSLIKNDSDQPPRNDAHSENSIDLDDCGSASDSELGDTEIENGRQRLKSKMRKDEEVLASEGSDYNDDDEESESEQEADQNKDVEKASTRIVPSTVDDSFFKLHEMEAFLESEDKKELKRLNGRQEYSDEINYFESLSDDSDNEIDGEKDAKSFMFADFFDTDNTVPAPTDELKQKRRSEREAKNIRKEKQMKEDLGMESSDEENGVNEMGDADLENDEAEASEFDLRQHRLQKRIEEYEEKALAEKPWQLKGDNGFLVFILGLMLNSIH